MLTTDKLTYQINGKTLVNQVSLSLNSGEVLAVVGQNGAGKSTLLKLLGGDLQASSGDIFIDGQSLHQLPASTLALKRAVMTQTALMAFEFTVYEVAMMGRYPHQRYGNNGNSDHDIVMESLAHTETDHLKDRFFPTLSGGEASRVTLSRVLAQKTPLLLLDEPTAALDLRHQQVVMKIARQLASAGAAVLIVLHDLNLAAAYADRIGIMRDGELYAIGTPTDVITEAHIQAAFNLPVIVTEHPTQNCPLIVPLEPN